VALVGGIRASWGGGRWTEVHLQKKAVYVAYKTREISWVGRDQECTEIKKNKRLPGRRMELLRTIYHEKTSYAEERAEGDHKEMKVAQNQRHHLEKDAREQGYWGRTNMPLEHGKQKKKRAKENNILRGNIQRGGWKTSRF